MPPFRFLLLCALLLVPTAAGAQAYLSDDPLRVDPDRRDVPKPEGREQGDLWDFVEAAIVAPGVDGPALNANTLGEVPNSSWYTMRHYWHPMTTAELVRGPDQTGGPASGTWTVVGGKTQGVTPGLRIEDARGDVYLIKFDPKAYPELATSAEVISTKLFHALGYHVPENTLVNFRYEDLEIDPEADIDDVPITSDLIQAMLARVPQRPDGSYRAVASKFLPGDWLGPFLYHGTRPDDANDIFPHERRRELRGLRVFAAWLNHHDARSVNSLDMFVEEEGVRYVKHHLIDFGSTLGSGAVKPKDPYIGYEYMIDFRPVLLSGLTLGLLGHPWMDFDFPGYHPSIGRIEAEHFDPVKWKSQYPNPAFRRMDADDAFWAAKQVMHFSDADLRAMVEVGALSNAEAEAYLAETLMKRRDKIGQAYLYHGGGIDRFAVMNNTLAFDDLPATYGLAATGVERAYAWYVFDNQTAAARQQLDFGQTPATAIPIPEHDAPYLLASIRTPDRGTTEVVVRRDAEGYTVVGIERYDGNRR